MENYLRQLTLMTACAREKGLDSDEEDTDQIRPVPVDPNATPSLMKRLQCCWTLRAELAAGHTARFMRLQLLFAQNHQPLLHCQMRHPRRKFLGNSFLKLHDHLNCAVLLLRLQSSTLTLHRRSIMPLLLWPVGDKQDFAFWNEMRKHNLVLWLDCTA